MTPKRLLALLSRGEVHVYLHPDIDELLVLQPDKNSDAKPYQTRQLLRLVERYALRVEADDG